MKLKDENRLWFGEHGDNVPRQKQFLAEIQDGVVPTSLLFHLQSGHNQEAKKELISLLPGIGNSFETPKPVRLISRLLNLVNVEPDDITLDFFSGSATTAHAVMQLNAEDGGNRRFIMVQLPEACDEKSEAAKAGYSNICEIGKERIRRGGAKILAEAEQGSRQLKLGEEEKPLPDIGFRVFKLDSSNLKTWDATPITPQEGDVIGELVNRIQCPMPESLDRLERRIRYLERSSSSQAEYLKRLTEMRGWLPTRMQVDELLKRMAHLEQMLEQAGKPRGRSFSLPSIRLPRLRLPRLDGPTWISLLMVLAASLLLWWGLGGVWSNLSLLFL